MFCSLKSLKFIFVNYWSLLLVALMHVSTIILWKQLDMVMCIKRTCIRFAKNWLQFLKDLSCWARYGHLIPVLERQEYLLWMLPYFLWLFAFFFAPRLLKAWEFVLCSFFSSLIWFEWLLHWGFLVGTFFNFSCQLKAPRNQRPFLIQTNWQK